MLLCLSNEKQKFVIIIIITPLFVPTSEALPPLYYSAQHSHPQPHSRSCPHRDQAASGPQIFGRLPPRHTRCPVTSVVFSDACSGSTFAAHHLILPLLTTMLAKSRNSQRESIVSRERTANTSLHQSLDVDFATLKAWIRTASGKERGENTEAEVIRRAWGEGREKPRKRFLRNDG